jgi:DNA-binding Xre family transcriptional regulator
MDFMERISRNVEKRRKKLRLSADRLSKKADISISTLVKIRRLETKDLKVSTFLALAKALDCSLDELVG